MRQQLREDLYDLMMTPGLSGHEERVAKLIRPGSRMPVFPAGWTGWAM
jgi:hypothetical protein